MLCVTLAGMYRVSGKLEESSEQYRIAYKYAEQVPSYQLIARYELGHNYFIQGQWNEAIPLIEEYLEKTSSENFRAFGGYKLGLCYWITEGNSAVEKITKLYNQVIHEWTRARMSYDVYASRLCQQFLQTSSFSK